MKTIEINICHELKSVSCKVWNGAAFERAIIKGEYKDFDIELSEDDYKRVARFALRHCNNHYSGRGSWFAQCNGYAMGLTIYGFCGRQPRRVTINTYRAYGKTWQDAGAPDREFIRF